MTRRCVLVAEDDPAIGRLISLILSREGIPCDVVRDGRAALARLDAERYEIFICDLMMPVMNGYEVVEALREKTPRPIVLILTAMTPDTCNLDPDVVSLVIRKPFEMETFAEVIRVLCRELERSAQIGSLDSTGSEPSAPF